jgi:hypothetical protein
MKYTIKVEENLTYERQFTVNVPEEIGEEEFEEILDRVGHRDMDDIYYDLDRFGIIVVDCADDDMSSPIDAEYEITEFDVTEEDSDDPEDGCGDDE